MVRARTDQQRGGVLLAFAVALVIVALSVFAVHAMRQAERQRGIGAGRQPQLSNIDAALAQFVARQRRLPCPARGSAASGAITAGVESINLGTGACNPATQIDGVVPWLTLGLAETDALDAWNGRISYRVQPSLASNTLSLMNMSWCDPGGATNGATGASTACTPSPCTTASCRHPSNYLYGKGLQVQDAAGAWLNQPAPAWTGTPAPPPVSTGAAYVLISHGGNGLGAYNANGTLQGTAPLAGSKEGPNQNGQALTGTLIFVDTAPNNTAGLGYFDDVLSHPTIAAVLAQARLGPRTPH